MSNRFKFGSTKKDRVSVPVPPKIMGRLTAIATKHDTNVPQVAATLLEVGLEEYEKENKK